MDEISNNINEDQPKIPIRDGSVNDSSEIVRLISMHAKESNEFSPITSEFVKQYLKSTMSKILLAELDGQTVGLLSYSLRPDLYHAGYSCFIEEFFVQVEYRECGVGGSLFNELFIRLIQYQCVEVSLAVMADNSKAIRFYHNYGLNEEALLLERHFRYETANESTDTKAGILYKNH